MRKVTDAAERANRHERGGQVKLRKVTDAAERAERANRHKRGGQVKMRKVTVRMNLIIRNF